MKKAVEAVFTVWLILITIRYGQSVLRGIAAPLNPGSDIEWFALWLIATIVIAIGLATWSGILRVVSWVALLAIVAISVLSGAFLAALLASWLVVVAYGWGQWLLRVAGVEPQGFLETVALAVPVGSVIPAFSGFVLAGLHWFNATSLSLLLLVLTVLQLKTILRLKDSRVAVRKFQADIALPILLTLPVVVLNFIWAVAPEIQFDANNYHLAVPSLYLANGGFIDLPYFFHSYLAHLVEMLYAFPIALQGLAAAKLLSFIFSLIATCCVWSLGKDVFDTRIACWAAAFFYTTPIVSWLAGTSSTDNIVAMFLTAAILAFVKWYRAAEGVGWLYISALLAGMAAAAKMNAAFGLFVLIVVILRNTRHLAMWRVSLLLLIMAAVVIPWYGLTYHWTQNPVFPMMNGFFKSPLWPPINNIVNSNSFGIGISLSSMGRLPFRLVLSTERFGETSPRGSAGLALLIAFPFAILLGLKNRGNERLLLAIAVVYGVLWSFTFQYSRYFVHILPVICVLAAATVFQFDSTGYAASVRRVCLACGLIMQVPIMPVQFWNIPERFPVQSALGLEKRDHFLNRALLGYAAVQHLNAVIKPGDRVIGVDMEQTRVYLNAPLESLPGSTLNSRLRDVAAMPPDDSLLQHLRKDGFRYILVSRAALHTPPMRYPYLNRDFLNRFATVEFMNADTVLFRLQR